MGVSAKKISSYNELELKGYLISLIERAKDRSQLLLFVEAVNDIFDDNKEEDAATFWSRYTPEQRIELEQAFEESHASKEWISHEDMKKKHEKWLKG